MYKTEEEIYRIIDSFLTEAQDSSGNFRSLERLNKDRHLAAEQLENLVHRKIEEERESVREWAEEKMELHTHNSIPSYTADLDEGCVICLKNKPFDNLLAFLNSK
jgi:hypothetical protein